MTLPKHLSATYHAERRQQEYRALAELTGRTVAELDADTTAPDPGGDTMHALSELERLWQQRQPRRDVTIEVDGMTLDVDCKTQVGRLFVDGDPHHLLVYDGYCAYCAKYYPIESHDGEARCEHKRALDAVLAGIYSADQAMLDYSEDVENRYAHIGGVL